MIKADVLAYLSNRSAHPDETVQYGWFIFRLVGNGGRLDIETLDFKQMASFTDDFSVVERIHQEQLRVLEREGLFGADVSFGPGHALLRAGGLVSPSPRTEPALLAGRPPQATRQVREEARELPARDLVLREVRSGVKATFFSP